MLLRLLSQAALLIHLDKARDRVLATSETRRVNHYWLVYPLFGGVNQGIGYEKPGLSCMMDDKQVQCTNILPPLPQVDRGEHVLKHVHQM